LWKSYFYFTVVLTVCSIALAFLGAGESNMLWWEWWYVPLYFLQAVSLFGFVYWRRIVSSAVWKTVFVFSVGDGIWNAYDMATNWFSTATPVLVTVVSLVVYLVQVPLWYGNFLYAFRCKVLWNAKT
jgi:hypothetical protein